jgi:hypothetical protein
LLFDNEFTHTFAPLTRSTEQLDAVIATCIKSDSLPKEGKCEGSSAFFKKELLPCYADVLISPQVGISGLPRRQQKSSLLSQAAASLETYVFKT